MHKRWRSVAAAMALMLTAAGTVQGQSLLVSLSGCTGGPYGYGCSNWTNVTAALNTAFVGNVATATNLNDYGQMLSYDALWLDQRWTAGSLTATEVDNLTNYIATGRRVVLVGENFNWTSWNQQLAQIVGGSYEGLWYSGETATATAHQLTTGVNSIYVPAGGEMSGLMAGGVSLFTSPVATLWGTTQNALVMLDVNVWSDSYVGDADHATYLANTAEWLAASPRQQVTPEPITLVLLGSGLAGLAAVRRRRRMEPEQHA